MFFRQYPEAEDVEAEKQRPGCGSVADQFLSYLHELTLLGNISKTCYPYRSNYKYPYY